MTWARRWFKKVFWRDKILPVTHETVEPAEAPLYKAREVRVMSHKASREIDKTTRKAEHIRHKLAHRALEVVSGEMK